MKSFNRRLRDLIHVGKANPGTLVSHEQPLAQAPDAEKQCDDRDASWTEVILRPNAA